MQTDQVVKQELIDGLNEDLAAEYGAIIQYLYNAAVVTGLYRRVLKPFFAEEARDEIEHASYLAEKIHQLGGTPVVAPKPVQQVTGIRAMLEKTLQDEIDTIERYTKRIAQAERAGEMGLKVKLEDMLQDETAHKEEIERLLADPQLLPSAPTL